MSELNEQPKKEMDEESLHIAIYVSYGLLVLSLFTGFLTGLIGLLSALYFKNTAKGTKFNGHCENIITTFLVSFALAVLAFLTMPIFGLGFLVAAGNFVWFLYRVIKGIGRVIDEKPYA